MKKPTSHEVLTHCNNLPDCRRPFNIELDTYDEKSILTRSVFVIRFKYVKRRATTYFSYAEMGRSSFFSISTDPKEVLWIYGLFYGHLKGGQGLAGCVCDVA